MSSMLSGAISFNQNLCAWKDKFPYNNAMNIFLGSGCAFTQDPQLDDKGPFCSDECAVPVPVPSSCSASSSSKSAKVSKASKAKAITSNLQAQEMKSSGSSVSLSPALASILTRSRRQRKAGEVVVVTNLGRECKRGRRFRWRERKKDVNGVGSYERMVMTRLRWADVGGLDLDLDETAKTKIEDEEVLETIRDRYNDRC
eukprot:scaffold22544_cov78-Skeletonema_dohrnii-CCMP3373.AAC.2